MKTKEELLSRLSDCVCDMEDDEVVDVVKEYIVAGYDPQEGMLEGLVDGMKRASVLYEEGEYFVPELIVCSDAMYAGIEEFQKYLPDTGRWQSVWWKEIPMISARTWCGSCWRQEDLMCTILEEMWRWTLLWIMYGIMMWTFSACLP